MTGAAGIRARALPRPWSHALRHASITDYLDQSGGDIRGAAALSRHKDLRMLAHYDDNRRDLDGAAARVVARPGQRRLGGES